MPNAEEERQEEESLSKSEEGEMLKLLLALPEVEEGEVEAKEEKKRAAREAEEERKRAEEHAREEARLLLVEPHKDAPEQLYPFLQANPSALPPFVKHIVTDPTHAAWLGEAVKAAPSLAGLTDADDQHAFAFAHWECKQAFEII